MGCVVNGPGEMADADYGYVGEGRGHVTLYRGKNPVLRRIPQEDLDELKAIFDVTGGSERIASVEAASRRKAEEMGMDFEEYTKYTFEHCSPGHFNNE